MIEIFPASKVLVDSLRTSDELLVCVRGEKGTILFVTELTRYLKAKSRGQPAAKLAKEKPQISTQQEGLGAKNE